MLGDYYMANIIDYIKSSSKKSFDELPFNEIDNVIFASIAYLNLDGIVKEHYKDPVTIEYAGTKYFKKYTKKDFRNNIFAVQSAIKVLNAIYTTPRYKDLKLYNYVYKGDNTKQFSAIFIDISKRYTYISFEGTDELVSGWMEDAKLAYQFPVPSQREAIRYINKNIFPFSRRQYILGGHSKGGNLALVAGMYANHLIKPKIRKIYMDDAPGLKLKQIKSNAYRSIKNRVERIIPNYSIIGLMLRHTDEYHVILANKTGLLAHNIICWQTANNEFIKTNLSPFSKRLDKVLTEWLDSYNDEERKELVEDLFDVLNRAGITSLLDVKSSTLPSILAILKESKKINAESKKRVRKLLKILLTFFKEESKTLIKAKIRGKTSI